MTRFGPKVGEIGPKWDKSGDFFSEQIQYIFARRAKLYSILSEKNVRICPIFGKSDPSWAQIWSLWYVGLLAQVVL